MSAGNIIQLADGRFAQLVVVADASGASTVGIEGADGSTQVSSSNPLPTVDSPNTLAASGIAPNPVSALATSKVLKASAGNLYSLNLKTTTVAGSFLLHNATSAPAAGAVTPARAWDLGVGQSLDLTFNPPLRLSTGISITFTSAATPFTQTDSATAFISGEAV